MGLYVWEFVKGGLDAGNRQIVEEALPGIRREAGR
jgi:hypothetical protein